MWDRLPRVWGVPFPFITDTAIWNGRTLRYVCLSHALHATAIVAQFVWFSKKGLGGSILRAKWDAIGGLAWAISARRKVQATRTVDSVTVRQLLDRSPLRSRFRARLARA